MINWRRWLVLVVLYLAAFLLQYGPAEHKANSWQNALQKPKAQQSNNSP